MEQVKDYVQKKHYNPVKCEDNTMFCFGEKLGTGEDNDHFQLGFTSLTLLMRTLWTGMFHIDATYKIIKYFYPLMIFGITDLNHSFFPIAFMVSSHETADDYLHFFKSLNKIVRRLVPNTNISFDFKPSHIVTDAAKAMAKAIKRTYPSCVLIMCWFHLKYNLRKHKSMLPNKAYLIVCKQINKLHECTCAGTYDSST